jgi:hypothetical protein
VRYFGLVTLLCSLILLSGEPLWGQTARVRSRAAAEPDEDGVVKSGQLRRSEQNVSGTPYLLIDHDAGTRFFVAPSDEEVDLESYVGEEVVLQGRFSTTRDGRRRNFLVSHVELAEEEPHVRPAGGRLVGLPREHSAPARRLDYAEPAPAVRQVAQATEIEDLGPVPELYGEYWDAGEPAHWGHQPLRPAPVLSTREMFWVRGEYLLWWPRGMNIPPLVTTSPTGTARADAGVLGEPATRILLGDEEINDHDMSGFRIRSGFWLDPTRSIGIEGDYFFLDQSGSHFEYSSLGSPIIARPFFDVLAGQETASLVAFPGVIRGDLTVDAETQLQSAGGRLRFNLGEGPLACLDPALCQVGGMQGTGYRVDGLLGYRYLQLEDSLRITERSTSLQSNLPGSFHIRDFFETRNEFHGGEVGMMYEVLSGPWVLDFLVKVAIGSNRQVVRATGQSDITEAGATTSFSGGTLVQRTSAGEFARNRFAMIPELGANLGYQLTPNWRATAGYSLLYMGGVVRAGDQVDLDLNPNLFPPEVSPFSGPLRPRVLFRETDFWAHGLSVGLELRR